MTSFTESFPLTILESAFYEKTVISTDVGGISMLIENGINGYLFKPGDSISLAQKMLELLLNKEKAKELGKKLYLKASSKYSINNLVESYLDAYDKVIAGGNVV
jgi:glycosyltransferase involved in cell wall biosynthesis